MGPAMGPVAEKVPARGVDFEDARVAQLVEQATFNRLAVGSSPTAGMSA